MKPSRGRLFRAALGWAAALGLLVAIASPRAWGAVNVLVVVSETTAPYRELADSLVQELERRAPRGFSVRVAPWQSLKAGDLAPPSAQVIVAAGIKATQAVVAAAPKAPVLAILIPRITFQQIAARAEGGRVSALYLDQPFARQLNLLRIALPGRQRLGVLLGPASQREVSALEAAAQPLGIEINAETVHASGELMPALERVLQSNEALLALPDPLVYNADTLQGLLLTSYRYQQPVIGFSPAYVRAGALLAVYSSPAQLGRQAGEILEPLRSGSPLPGPQYPKYFSVSVNYYVARSLGLAVAPEATLTDELSQAERRYSSMVGEGRPGPGPLSLRRLGKQVDP